MATNDSAARDYILSAKLVLKAGQQLHRVLEEDEEDLDARKDAIQQLERAARRQDEQGESYRAFMFAEVEKAEVAAEPVREQTADEVLQAVVADLQMADVYIAAGQGVGETHEEPRPELLDNALRRLKQTIEAAEGQPGAGRFNFAGEETPAPPALAATAKLPDAVKEFERLAGKTLDMLEDGTREVATVVVKALRESALKDYVSGAAKELGEKALEVAGGIGGFISSGLKKIKDAVGALVRLVGDKGLAQIKDRVVKLCQDFVGEDWLKGMIAGLLGTAAARAKVGEILALDGLDKDALDAGRADLARLESSYRQRIGTAKAAATLVGLASAVLLWLGGPHVLLWAALAYLAILCAAVLIGIDYVDSGGILRLVRGVGEIADGLRPA